MCQGELRVLCYQQTDTHIHIDLRIMHCVLMSKLILAQNETLHCLSSSGIECICTCTGILEY